MLFPEDPSKWTFPTRYVLTARTGADGRFTMRNVPPAARYLAVAVDYLEDGEFQDPEFLDRIKSQARLVSIDFGDRREIDLDVVQR